MKKFLLLSLLFLTSFLKAQTAIQAQKIIQKTNVLVLNTISENSKRAFWSNKKKATDLAKIFNWQLFLKDKDVFSELIGVSATNQPIYYSTFNQGAGVTSRANKLYNNGGLGLNIQGQNMTSGIWDAGAALPTHELFGGRVQILDMNTQTHPHATHVAGTIMGSNQFQNGLATGMAFMANLHSYDWNEDQSEVATAAANGLLLSNHSYGYSPSFVTDSQWGKYDQTSQIFDEIMFNAPYYQMVCAAGNSRGNYNTVKNGYDVITGHGLSKNAITVAAVEEVLNYTGPNSVPMSVFSSWGPVDDGRIKPDISAKGVNTFSSTDESNSSYSNYSGTSMASPSVNGTLLLLQQYYNQINNTFMKAASLKGLMIHSADEAGANPGPDYGFGWGLINAEKAADIITKNGLQSAILENTLAQHDSFTIAVNALGTEPLVATLCWTDPKGNLPSQTIDDATPNLINDLDIRITKNTDTFFPWKLNVANPSLAATNGDNLVDNVEKIGINNPSGSYTITVSHKGNLINNLQNYSLIISGYSTKDFWMTTSAKLKNICLPNNTATFPFELHTKTDFNETVAFSTINLPVGVIASFSPNSLSADGNVVLNLDNLSSVAPGLYSFVIKGESPSDTFEMPVQLNLLNNSFSNIANQLPADNVNSVAVPVVFDWQADTNAQNYTIEVSNDINFATVLETATLSTNHFVSSLLSNNQTYFWRIKKQNQCGFSPFSAPISFVTACLSPTNIHIVAATTSTVNLAWTSNSATTWETEIVLHDQAPTGIGTTTTSNPLQISGLLPNTCYDFYIRNPCTIGNSVWSELFAFCTQPDYCSGDHFYDTGGISGNYQNNENYTKTIYPDVAGNRVKAVFNSFNIEYGWDFMRIYNGPDESYPLLYSGTGNVLPGTFASTDINSGALTFVFTSDNFQSAPGWDATIICETLPACPNGPSNITASTIGFNSATFSWIENSNATAWEIEVVPQGTTPTGIGTLINTNSYQIVGLESNSCYTFYVRSICSGGYSDWSMPNIFCTLTNYCGGEHFYDTGGSTGNYLNNEYKTVTIYPDTAGNRIKAIFNTFEIDYNSDYMVIFNGPVVSNTNYIYYSGNGIPPGTLASSDPSGALTFLFSSDNSTNFSGWDATIICEPLPPCPTVPGNLYAYNTTSTTTQLSWYDYSGTSSWEVEIVPAGSTPTGVGVVVNSTYFSANNLMSNTNYNFYVRGICLGGMSDWSQPGTFTTLADYCGGDHFYDNGGQNGNYPSYDYLYKTIFPNNNGDRIRAIFNSFDIESCCDSFTVYDGPSSNYPVIYSGISGIAPTELVATNPNGALTFYFNSNYQNNFSGWDATIICEPIPPCSFLPQNLSAYNITTNAAQLNWTDYNNTATSWEIEIVPEGALPTGIGQISNSYYFGVSNLMSNTIYFYYVRSLCAGLQSAWSLPGTFTTLADYCAGDHFYDNGGQNGNYPSYDYLYKTIYPNNNGDRIRAIFNSFDIESCCDSFTVYDGQSSNDPVIYSGISGIDPTELVATNPNGALTFYFNSNYENNFSGWDATIICEPFPACSFAPTNLIVSNTSATGMTLSWTNIELIDTSFEVEIVPVGSVPSGVGTITSTNSMVFSNLASGSCYNILVRSICPSAYSAWSIISNVCTTPDYCAGSHFFDSGGANGNYLDYENYTTIIYPSSPTNKVRATFNSFQTESGYDYMGIYNGDSSNSPLLFNGSGNTSPGTKTSTAVSGALTFVFTSDGSATYSGWDATINCSFLGTSNPEQNFKTLEYYPNPVQNLFFIKASENIIKYSIFSIDGKLIKESNIDQKEFSIDMSEIEIGTYMVKIENENNESRTIKVLRK